MLAQPADLGAVRAAIEQAGIEIGTAELTQRPKTRVTLDEQHAGTLLRLIDALEDNDDVERGPRELRRRRRAAREAGRLSAGWPAAGIRRVADSRPARSSPRALALAALTLLAPSSPSYDPFAWLVWGRELMPGAGGEPFGLAGGPSWKPLPVLFTTPFALAGDAAPALWLLVARAGLLLALAGAFALGRRLARRLAGASPPSRCCCSRTSSRSPGAAPPSRCCSPRVLWAC